VFRTERRRNTVTGSTAPERVRDEQRSVSELAGQAGEQLFRLVRREVALAKEELAEKGRRATPPPTGGGPWADVEEMKGRAHS
jgi:hypothetical protein